MAVVYAKNLQIKPVSGSPKEFYADWTWSDQNAIYNDCEEVRTQWTYYTADWVAFVGERKNSGPNDQGLVHPKFGLPDNAIALEFWIMPQPKVDQTKQTIYNKKGKKTGTRTITTRRFAARGVSASMVIEPRPAKPSAPSVNIDSFKLTTELNTYDENTKYVQFQVVKNDSTVVATGTSRVVTNHAAFTCNIAPGGSYKVRCRGRHNSPTSWGEWSEYSSNVGTIPANPNRITKHNVLSPTSIQIYWNEVTNATAYDIEYAVDKSYFDVSSNVQSVTADRGVTSRIIDNLESGQTWFFRVRASNSVGKSGWSEIYSVLLGKIPDAPTTWSDTTSVVVGETVDLYWMHNAEDGSSQTAAQIEITVNGTTKTITRSGSDISTETGVASYYTYDVRNDTTDTLLDSSGSNILDSSDGNILSQNRDIFGEGTTVEWRVRTKGILTTPNSGYGEWSVKRTIIVYASPGIELTVSQYPSFISPLDTLTSFPIYIRAVATPSTQRAVGWNLKVVSNQSYITEDLVGELKRVNKDSEVFSRYIPAESNTLSMSLSAGDIDLESGCSYTLTLDVAMDSGLTASSSLDFDVEWADGEHIPDAEISIDDVALCAYISPYCVDDEDVLVNNVVLSVYRREYDGRFKLIQDNIPNDRSISVTDPHPALDYARYRIVAMSQSTGEVDYYDPTDIPVGETSIIIQWDETFGEFLREEDNPDERVEEPWSGSVLRLPYNVSISDKYDMDVNLAEYIGRSHPVSYYGTQLGIGGSWSTDIPRDDTETLYALRRLAIYPGNVYVREPSGVGYWAKINVSLNKNYDSMLIPVSLDVTRVEGGV